MAKKSKTQRAKASAARAERKARAREAEAAAAEAKNVAETDDAATEAPKKGLLNKIRRDSGDTEKQPVKVQETKQPAKAREKKSEKKQHFAFLKDVRAELKRVTWPTKQDVLRWSVVVVAALVFFGVYVMVLDNAIITPLLVAISGLGA